MVNGLLTIHDVSKLLNVPSPRCGIGVSITSVPTVQGRRSGQVEATGNPPGETKDGLPLEGTRPSIPGSPSSGTSSSTVQGSQGDRGGGHHDRYTHGCDSTRGLCSYDSDSADLLRTYAASRRRFWRSLRLPVSMPLVFTALS